MSFEILNSRGLPLNQDPCEIGDPSLLRPPATILVIFGASGDLSGRKLLPALANLYQSQLLPERFAVIGASRTEYSDEEFRELMGLAVQEHSRQEVKTESWAEFSKNIFYQPLNATRREDFISLKERIANVESSLESKCNYVFYLATASRFFVPICELLSEAGLITEPQREDHSSIVVVEKPFGQNLASATELNYRLRACLHEEQIYRIDHYLGKETVQSILGFRFENRIIEPLFTNVHVDSIQVSVCEDIGLGSRAGYFDQSGILRDIIQNHALQMLALVCMEPPSSILDADSIRGQKTNLLRQIKVMDLAEVARNVVRGRYGEGISGGQQVPAYINEPDVDPDRMTETYVALRLEMPSSWRWAGVPIYIRAGKRMKKKITEVTLTFKEPPADLSPDCSRVPQNVLTFQVQPQEGIRFTVNSKHPGPRMAMRPVNMDFSIAQSFGVPTPDAYERLLLDAMNGDATLFTRDDEIEAAWNLLEPVLTAWQGPTPPPLEEYASGSWGPAAADQLLAEHGARWLNF